MTHEFMPDDDYLAEIGEVLPQEVIDKLTVKPARTIDELYRHRPGMQPIDAMNDFMNAVEFRERYGHMKVVDDMIGLQRVVGGKVETYRDKLLRAESQGKVESARFGTGTIMGEKAVIFALDWDYFAGSLGEVAGEKFVRAAELAEREKMPLVSIGASSGVRQYENVLGLVQMQRMAVAANKFQHNSHMPYVSVLAGQVWGGMSASAVPIADMVVALEGTDYGFADRRIIETFENRPVAAGAQSAEANALNRNIDVMVKDVPELLAFLGRSLHTVRQSQGRKVTIPEWHHTVNIDSHATSRPISFGGEGFYPAMWEAQRPEKIVMVERQRADLQEETNQQQLIARYNEIVSSSRRIDSEFIMQNAFDTATPLYNVVQFEDTKKYPNIIASVASIGDQGFMVIGDQPSYIARSDTFVSKRAPNPGPQDFEYATRMVRAAERWQLPIVFLTDTLGALPSMAAEQRGQSRAIAEAIKVAGSHPYPTISVVTGALGSGGGLATTPFGRETIMLDSSLAFVTEPRSMASLLYNTDHPTDEQVAITLETIHPTAADLRSQGLVDTVVHDGENPYRTVNDLRAAIIDAFDKQRGKNARKLRQSAVERLTPKMISKRQTA